jgi:hypothetical protein
MEHEENVKIMKKLIENQGVAETLARFLLEYYPDKCSEAIRLFKEANDGTKRHG